MKEISSLEEFNLLAKTANLVVDFSASWCGPCRALAPVLESLETNDLCQIVKVDIDQLSDLASQYSISGIPTVVFLKNGTEVQRFVGLRTKQVLQDKVNELNAE